MLTIRSYHVIADLVSLYTSHRPITSPHVLLIIATFLLKAYGFLENWRFGFLSVKNDGLGKIPGVKTEDIKIDSLKMLRLLKCESSVLKCEDSEDDTPQ